VGLELIQRLCRLHRWEVQRGVSEWGGAQVRVIFQQASTDAPSNSIPLKRE
jgi:hypothetical protein